MECSICHKTEEDFAAMNFAQNSQIEEIRAKINEKMINSRRELINVMDDDKTNHSESINDYSNICENINNQNCNVCTQSNAIDGKGYFWCKKYNKSSKKIWK